MSNTPKATTQRVLSNNELTYNLLVNSLFEVLGDYEKRSFRTQHRKNLCNNLRQLAQETIPKNESEPRQPEQFKINCLVGAIYDAMDKAHSDHEKNGTLSFFGSSTTSSSFVDCLSTVIRQHKKNINIAKEYSLELFQRHFPDDAFGKAVYLATPN